MNFNSHPTEIQLNQTHGSIMSLIKTIKLYAYAGYFYLKNFLYKQINNIEEISN